MQMMAGAASWVVAAADVLVPAADAVAHAESSTLDMTQRRHLTRRVPPFPAGAPFAIGGAPGSRAALNVR